MDSNTSQAVALMKKAIALLERTPPPAVQAVRTLPAVKDDELVLEGTVDRLEYKLVGANQFPLFTASLVTERGTTQIQAWKRVADWANTNLAEGSLVRAIGRFEENTWTNKRGEAQVQRFFSVRLFEAA